MRLLVGSHVAQWTHFQKKSGPTKPTKLMHFSGSFFPTKVDQGFESGQLLNWFFFYSAFKLYYTLVHHSTLVNTFMPTYRADLIKSKGAEVYTSCTMSWGCWKHPFGIPGVRPMFFKPKLPKESKNGFKTINYRPPLLVIFSKTVFSTKKIIK